MNKGDQKKARIAKQLVGYSIPSKTTVNKFKFPPRSQQKQAHKLKKNKDKGFHSKSGLKPGQKTASKK